MFGVFMYYKTSLIKKEYSRNIKLGYSKQVRGAPVKIFEFFISAFSF